jgi:iron complex transport system substrate-binding protein
MNLSIAWLVAAVLAAGAPALAAPPQAARANQAAAPSSTAVVTDIRGRKVRVTVPARRLLIDDGRFLVALSLIHPDPISVLAAWPRDINRIGEVTFQRYRTKFPAIDKLTQVTSSAGTFSLEQALAATPDVAVFSLGAGPTDAQVARFEAAGIPVVFIDFFNQPFENAGPSLTLLGQITGRTARAEAFLQFRQERLDRIASRLRADKSPAPKVFLEAHAGISPECCNSVGKGNVGDYITFVGGHNLGADVLPGASGRVNLEYIVSRNPDVYIATGGPHLEKPGGLVVGPGYTLERARASLVKMTQRPGIGLLPAVKNGRTHGLAHQLINSPLDILAVEVLAKWIRPRLFADVDPARTAAALNESFLAIPLEGTNWVDLR